MPFDNGDISYLAETDFRGAHKLFGIKQADRLHHLYMIGKTGVGKSTLLELVDLAGSRGRSRLRASRSSRRPGGAHLG